VACLFSSVFHVAWLCSSKAGGRDLSLYSKPWRRLVAAFCRHMIMMLNVRTFAFRYSVGLVVPFIAYMCRYGGTFGRWCLSRLTFYSTFGDKKVNACLLPLLFACSVHRVRYIPLPFTFRWVRLLVRTDGRVGATWR